MGPKSKSKSKRADAATEPPELSAKVPQQTSTTADIVKVAKTEKIVEEQTEKPVKEKRSRKRAADMFDDAPEKPSVEKASKKVKSSEPAEVEQSGKSKRTKPAESKPAAPTEKEADPKTLNGAGSAGKAKKSKSSKKDKTDQVQDKDTKAVTSEKAEKSRRSKKEKVAQPSDVSADSKKRKAPEEPAESAVKPVAKKSKKKAKGAAETVADAVSNGVEALSKGVETVLDAASDLVGAKSISDEVAETAEEVIDLKEAEGEAGEDDDESDSAEDDQTAALLKGFDDSEDDAADDDGFEPGKPVPKIEKSKAVAKKLKKANAASDDEPGVIYVGRIPHGFHEHEMREYFSQFGTVNHVRLSRSKKTGGSKHYAFLQFASEEVAKIVADTMNNYLLFGHILKCQVVPPDQVHEKMWIGADKRFKVVPWNKLEGRKLALPKGRSEWDKKVTDENKRRENKQKKLKELGYDFEMPKVKSVDEVPVKTVVVANGENGVVVAEEVMKAMANDQPVAAIQEAPTTVEEAGIMPKKKK